MQNMHTAFVALTSCEANDMFANSRKNPLEARWLVSMSGMVTGVRLRDTKVANRLITLPQVHFHLEE